LAEFAEEMKIYIQDSDGKILRTTLKVLLPKAFRK